MRPVDLVAMAVVTASSIKSTHNMETSTKHWQDPKTTRQVCLAGLEGTSVLTEPATSSTRRGCNHAKKSGVYEPNRLFAPASDRHHRLFHTGCNIVLTLSVGDQNVAYQSARCQLSSYDI
jgi:hypothetical protein